MATSGHPVGLGFVESLARPGGNVTGISFLGETLHGKLLELLKRAVPRASRVAIFWNPANRSHEEYMRDVQAAARSLGITLLPLELREWHESEPAFASLTRGHADALLLFLDPLFTAKLQPIAAFAAKNRLPVIYGL